MYEFVTLDMETVAPYCQLTYPRFRSQLLNIAANDSLVAVGVHFEKQPVGLGLSSRSSDGTLGEILSLFVVTEHRHCGLGTALLTYMEEELYRRGCKQVSLVYMSSATTSALERILEQRHWSTPQLRMLICLGNIDKIQNAPWLKLNNRLSPGYRIFPWVQLTSQEREAIQTQQALSPWYPDILCPFKEENIIEPLNSLGLYYQGEVVGWMITHRIAADTVRYTRLFVRQDLQLNGRAIPMLATAINLQVQNKEVYKISFTVDVDNTQMVRFVQRRLAPYLTSIRLSMGTTKLLYQTNKLGDLKIS